MERKTPAVFDLHCDTVSACYTEQKALYRNDLQLDLEDGLTLGTWVQTFAFWIDDCYRGAPAWEHLKAQYTLFAGEYHKNQGRIALCRDFQNPQKGACNAVLSVEGGAVVEDRLERVGIMKDWGISMMNLVWNGENQIGSGVLGHPHGLTPLGKEIVREMERQNIIVDVSHLNEAGFADLEQIAEKPFIASHSNAKSICPHPRNLNDGQVRCIAERGGLIGINFYPAFVNGESDCTFDELFRHIEHMLVLGAGKCLALGSDFDGADMPSVLSDVKKLENLRGSMVECFGKTITREILFENASRFFNKNVKIRGKISDVLPQYEE